jgi:tetratricopeptide (TPR) repeat protein
MPATGAELFGRQKELKLLDEAWEDPGLNVVSLVAWGGVGKTTLINKWLERMAADNYRGAWRVYAWSFYSQGTGDRVTSADLFISQALEWFGDPDPTKGSPWAKGERLAGLARQEKTLLLLDGMEPLQSYFEYERGKVKDPALATLLAELARDNPGLVVVTTRENVADLDAWPDTARQRDLEQISAEAGRALLRVGGVMGTDHELEETTRAFGRHALALNLLAAYLRDLPGHPIATAYEIPYLEVPEEKGKHPRRVMAAFADRFGEGPEVEVLRMLGLFDRPASGDEIAALRAKPSIPGLTERLQGLGEGEWLRLLGELRRSGLIAPESHHQPDTLDAHPLVREHFGNELERAHPDAWREGHNQLYEHLKATAKEYPYTLEEMIPLLAAVSHGCQAGRHQEALDEVYRRRIQGKKQSFLGRTLGALSAELAVLSRFLDVLWSQPAAGLSQVDKAEILNDVGYDLWSVGRLTDAAQPLKTSLEILEALKDWREAAVPAGNLCGLALARGDLTGALDYGRKSIKLAERSGDIHQRIAKRVYLADALHQAGQLEEAEAFFLEAEAIQKKQKQSRPLLYSSGGFYYCDLLLSLGKYQEVRRRAAQTIELARDWPYDEALDHLSLGLSHMLQAVREGGGNFTQVAHHLEQAVNGFRQAGTQDPLPRGLLARAAFRRVMDDFERARADLEEAVFVAERGGMRLYQADCHLEYARLYLATDDDDQAREHLATAKAMIEDMGYHRRDGEVAELEKRLTE